MVLRRESLIFSTLQQVGLAGVITQWPLEAAPLIQEYRQ